MYSTYLHNSRATNTLLWAEAWTQVLVCMWVSTLFGSTLLAQFYSGPTGTLHLDGTKAGIHLDACCLVPAVIPQHSAQFFWILKYLRDHSLLLQSQLEFTMPLTFLLTFANSLLFFCSLYRKVNIFKKKSLGTHHITFNESCSVLLGWSCFSYVY